MYKPEESEQAQNFLLSNKVQLAASGYKWVRQKFNM